MSKLPDSPKKTKTITVAMCDEDVEALDACRSLDKVFPPTRAELFLALARDAMSRLLTGEAELIDIYQNFGLRPVSVVDVQR